MWSRRKDSQNPTKSSRAIVRHIIPWWQRQRQSPKLSKFFPTDINKGYSHSVQRLRQQFPRQPQNQPGLWSARCRCCWQTRRHQPARKVSLLSFIHYWCRTDPQTHNHRNTQPILYASRGPPVTMDLDLTVHNFGSYALTPHCRAWDSFPSDLVWDSWCKKWYSSRSVYELPRLST
jgi:hypothetical protein